jgi:hypothetical protein
VETPCSVSTYYLIAPAECSANLADLAPEFAHQVQHALNRGADAGLDALPHQLAHHAHAHAAQVGGVRHGDGLAGPAERGGVHGVVPHDVRQQERRV